MFLRLAWVCALVPALLVQVPHIAGADEPANRELRQEFHALYFDSGRSPFDFSASIGTFTLAGPKLDTLRPLPANTRYVAYDPEANQYYSINRSSVHKVDLATKKSERMLGGPNVPEIGWACGIAFDSKRKRVIVVSLEGVGRMFAYAPKSEQWSLVTELNNVDLSGITYEEQADVLYGLHRQRLGGGGLVLSHYNARGAVIKTTELDSSRFPPGFGDAQMFRENFDLVMLNGKVVIVRSDQFSLIDPQTGEIQQVHK